MKLDLNNFLAGKKVFLTGGTGLFGKWLVPTLCQLAESVVILTRDSTNAQRSLSPDFYENLSLIDGDVRTFCFPNKHFDYLIHAATPVSVSSTIPRSDKLLSIIVDGTKRTIDFARDSRIGKLLFLSSGAVYGPQPKDSELFSESSICSPASTYGKGKLIAENLCLGSGLDCVVARCFAFVGPYMPLNAHFAIGNILGNCLRNEPIIIKGDGQSLRSFMYSTDLVDWLLTMLYASKKNEIYNVGSAVSISIKDLAYLVRKVVGKEKLPIIIQNDGSMPSSSYIPNNEKATKQLGLNVKIDLENAILKTFQSYRD